MVTPYRQLAGISDSSGRSFLRAGRAPAPSASISSLFERLEEGRNGCTWRGRSTGPQEGPSGTVGNSRQLSVRRDHHLLMLRNTAAGMTLDRDETRASMKSDSYRLFPWRPLLGLAS